MLADPRAATIAEIFQAAGALRTGHFLLKSGRHSDRYLEKFAVLQYPSLASNIQPTDHIQYRRTSIVNSEEVNYQIDVVTERYLPNLLDVISNELEETARLLSKEQTVVRAATNKIIGQARRAKKYDDVKAALDFKKLL